jgi:hypothetical protein
MWVLYRGSVCEQAGWMPSSQRQDRCDVSLFQTGVRRLAYLLNADFLIPVAFHIEI